MKYTDLLLYSLASLEYLTHRLKAELILDAVYLLGIWTKDTYFFHICTYIWVYKNDYIYNTGCYWLYYLETWMNIIYVTYDNLPNKTLY